VLAHLRLGLGRAIALQATTGRRVTSVRRELVEATLWVIRLEITERMVCLCITYVFDANSKF
jgi:hypothetical protein